MKTYSLLGAVIEVANALKDAKPYIDRINSYVAAGDTDNEKKTLNEATHLWAERLVKKFSIDVNLVGEENLPTEGPYVLIANHQSYLDIVLILYIVKTQLGFVAKKELTKVPVLSGWIRRIKGLFIDRKSVRSSLKTINEGADLLKKGYSMVIFPEGTRTRTGEMGEFKAGSFKLATKTGAPIVPVTINGAFELFEKRKRLVTGQRVTITVHPRVETKNMPREEFASLPGMVEEIVRSAL